MKELWQLIKMLFSSKPGDFDTPELLAMKHYPFKGYRFMMWCGRMIYRAENKENIDRYMQTYAGKESLTHETIHLRQAQVIGSWATNQLYTLSCCILVFYSQIIFDR